jgi:hypothetical protein
LVVVVVLLLLFPAVLAVLAVRAMGLLVAGRSPTARRRG